jgi:hypothetical protein
MTRQPVPCKVCVMRVVRVMGVMGVMIRVLIMTVTMNETGWHMGTAGDRQGAGAVEALLGVCAPARITAATAKPFRHHDQTPESVYVPARPPLQSRRSIPLPVAYHSSAPDCPAPPRAISSSLVSRLPRPGPGASCAAADAAGPDGRTQKAARPSLLDRLHLHHLGRP